VTVDVPRLVEFAQALILMVMYAWATWKSATMMRDKTRTRAGAEIYQARVYLSLGVLLYVLAVAIGLIRRWGEPVYWNLIFVQLGNVFLLIGWSKTFRYGFNIT